MTSHQDPSSSSSQTTPPPEDTPLDELQQKINEAEAKDQAIQAEAEVVDEKAQKIGELTNALARSMADLQNYKRRTEEERLQWMKVSQADLLKEILPIVDHFDRASKHLPEDLKENGWARGIIQIHDDLMKTLFRLGVQKIETVGQKVNPTLHDAMVSVPGEKDMIVEEFEAGYKLGDIIIKPAKVSVGNGETAPEKNLDG